MKNTLKRTLLVVDDEQSICNLISTHFSDDYRVLRASSSEEALSLLAEHSIDVVLTDLRLLAEDGITLLKNIKRIDSVMPVILMTAFGSIESAVQAIREGAYDYLTKPIEMKRLEQVILQAVSHRKIREENIYLREQLGEEELPELVGTSEAMLAVKQTVREVAQSDLPVLITGETGTGKGVVARTIHFLSGRSGLCVRVNCAALPEQLLESELFGHLKGAFTGAIQQRRGKFLLASGGTLFLDEISSMAPALQAKLLQVLDDGTYSPLGSDDVIQSDARIVAATNENLEQAVKDGRFRQDLFFRLNVISIKLPSLSSRTRDIPVLARYLLERIPGGEGKDFDIQAIEYLVNRGWPGNVRELENIVRRAFIRSGDRDIIRREDFAEEIPREWEKLSLKEALSRTEKVIIEEALRKTGGKKTRAAELLGITPRMMSYYLDKHPELKEKLETDDTETS